MFVSTGSCQRENSQPGGANVRFVCVWGGCFSCFAGCGLRAVGGELTGIGVCCVWRGRALSRVFSCSGVIVRRCGGGGRIPPGWGFWPGGILCRVGEEPVAAGKVKSTGRGLSGWGAVVRLWVVCDRKRSSWDVACCVVCALCVPLYGGCRGGAMSKRVFGYVLNVCVPGGKQEAFSVLGKFLRGLPHPVGSCTR